MLIIIPLIKTPNIAPLLIQKLLAIDVAFKKSQRKSPLKKPGIATKTKSTNESTNLFRKVKISLSIDYLLQPVYIFSKLYSNFFFRVKNLIWDIVSPQTKISKVSFPSPIVCIHPHDWFEIR